MDILMNVLMMLLGLLPLVCLSIFLIIKKKKILIPSIALIFSIICITLVAFNTNDKNVSQPKDGAINSYLTYINIKNGSYDKAIENINEMIDENGATVENTRLSMYICLLQNDENKAKAKCESLNILSKKEDVKLTELDKAIKNYFSPGSMSYADMYAQYKTNQSIISRGEKVEDYGYVNVTLEDVQNKQSEITKIIENIKKTVDKNIEDYKKKDTNASKIEEALNIVNEYNGVTTYRSNDEEDFNKLKGLHQLYLSVPDTMRVEAVRTAYINGLIRFEKYDELVEFAMDSGYEDALVSVAHLYLKEKITDKNISKKFLGALNYKDIAKKCLDIYKNVDKSKLSAGDLNKLKLAMNKITAQFNNPVLVEIVNRIDALNNNTSKKSEYCFQSSVILGEIDEEAMMEELFEEAVAAAVFSDNSEYKAAMGNVSTIIANSSSSSTIVKLPDYINTAFDSSLPESMKYSDISVSSNFLDKANSSVNKLRTGITIGSIDTTDFKKVTITVSTNSIDLLNKNDYVLKDCGVEIKDFTVKKVTYSASNVVLVCDLSGSMSGSVEDLKNAVKSYLNIQNKNENISIVTFASNVKNYTELLSKQSNTELYDLVENFASGGGTNISSGVERGFSLLNDTKTNNVIILMTDGQDSSYSSQSQLEALKQKCIDNNVTIYCIGLGSVDESRLTSIAVAGNGDFVYNSSSSQIAAMYEYLHNKVANLYEITYNASDTSSNNRNVTIEYDAKGTTASKDYYLNLSGGSDNTDNKDEVLDEFGDGESYESTNLPSFSDVYPSKIYRSTQTVSLRVYASNVDTSKKLSVYIKDKNNNSYKVENVNYDNNRITFELPSNLGSGKYTVYVIYDGNAYKIGSTEIIDFMKVSELVYGAYTFKADQITKSGNMTYLNGNVILNDYLTFKGQVTLYGDLEHSMYIEMSTDSASYITMADQFEGLLKSAFTNVLTISRFDNFKLYNDIENMYDYDNYRVDSQKLFNIPLIFGPIIMQDPEIKLYPEYLEINLMEFKLDLPDLDGVFGYVKGKAPFMVKEAKASVFVTGDKFDLYGNFDASSSYSELKFLKIPIEIDELKIYVNTIKNDYAFALGVKSSSILPSLSKDSDDSAGFGFNFEIEGGKFKSIGAKLLYDFVVWPEPPISIGNFEFQVDNLNIGNDLLEKLYKAKYVAGMEVSLFKISAVIPQIEWLVGDVDLLSIADMKGAVTFEPFSREFSAKLEALGCIELGSASIIYGNYTFNQPFIGCENTKVIGFEMKASQGFKWNPIKEVNMDIGGSTNVILNNKFMGYICKGNCNVDIDLCGIKPINEYGVAIVGINGDQMDQFTIMVRLGSELANAQGGFSLVFKSSEMPEFALY